MALDISIIKAPEPIRAALQKMSGHIQFYKFDEKGANGYTFFGSNSLLNRKIVVKFYYWGGEKDTFPEPKRLAELKCPEVLPIFDAAPVDSDYAYFVTEFCENGDLDQYLEKQEFHMRNAIDAMVNILSGISYLHANGYVHRDLKPSNIFVNAEGRLIIGDFGSVRKMSGDWASSPSTHSRLYRPPETYQAPKYHKTGDIYQAGLLMFQLMGGYLPYEETAWLNEKQQAEYMTTILSTSRLTQTR